MDAWFHGVGAGAVIVIICVAPLGNLYWSWSDMKGAGMLEDGRSHDKGGNRTEFAKSVRLDPVLATEPREVAIMNLKTSGQNM